MRDMPSRVRLDPDYNGHQRQVVGWASDVPVDDEHGWTEYVRADLSDALLREAMGAFENAMGHLDTPISRRKIGIDPNEEWLLDARATLAKLRRHLGEMK